MDKNEMNINDDTLEEVSGGVPVGNHSRRDENGTEHKIPSSVGGSHQNGMQPLTPNTINLPVSK